MNLLRQTNKKRNSEALVGDLIAGWATFARGVSGPVNSEEGDGSAFIIPRHSLPKDGARPTRQLQCGDSRTRQRGLEPGLLFRIDHKGIPAGRRRI